MDKEKFVADLIKNSKWTEEDKDWLLGLDETQLEKMVPVTNTEPPAEPKTETPKEEPKTEEPKEPTTNQVQKTPEQYLSEMPPQMIAMWNRGMKKYEAEKLEYVDKILANKNCVFTREMLLNKEADELEMLAKLAVTEVKADAGAVNYSGLAPVANQQNAIEPLALPKMDFSK